MSVTCWNNSKLRRRFCGGYFDARSGSVFDEYSKMVAVHSSMGAVRTSKMVDGGGRDPNRQPIWSRAPWFARWLPFSTSPSCPCPWCLQAPQDTAYSPDRPDLPTFQPRVWRKKCTVGHCVDLAMMFMDFVGNPSHRPLWYLLIVSQSYPLSIYCLE